MSEIIESRTRIAFTTDAEIEAAVTAEVERRAEIRAAEFHSRYANA